MHEMCTGAVRYTCVLTGAVLHVAAKNCSLRCLDLVLSLRSGSGQQLDVDVEQIATDRQQTALMMAAEHGHVNVLRRLVEAGCDVNRQTMECSSALIVACHYGYVECVNLLLGGRTMGLRLYAFILLMK